MRDFDCVSTSPFFWCTCVPTVYCLLLLCRRHVNGASGRRERERERESETSKEMWLELMFRLAARVRVWRAAAAVYSSLSFSVTAPYLFSVRRENQTSLVPCFHPFCLEHLNLFSSSRGFFFRLVFFSLILRLPPGPLSLSRFLFSPFASSTAVVSTSLLRSLLPFFFLGGGTPALPVLTPPGEADGLQRTGHTETDM